MKHRVVANVSGLRKKMRRLCAVPRTNATGDKIRSTLPHLDNSWYDPENPLREQLMINRIPILLFSLLLLPDAVAQVADDINPDVAAVISRRGDICHDNVRV
ncbi:MAG: hypothetical protein GY758_35065 [Fuerstiella sp.]|nr:hypothetical protein [Fuerstiella sp.]MCP4511954.1 hypothetical protein [Fuerstiella sp.]MCP4784721.1 hypothetical protein [Fuerstiella sp.]MCP4853460.1 hypothetical protein [Fuerstiella sp.]